MIDLIVLRGWLFWRWRLVPIRDAMVGGILHSGLERSWPRKMLDSSRVENHWMQFFLEACPWV